MMVPVALYLVVATDKERTRPRVYPEPTIAFLKMHHYEEFGKTKSDVTTVIARIVTGYALTTLWEVCNSITIVMPIFFALIESEIIENNSLNP